MFSAAAEMQPPVFVKELQDMEVGEGEKLELDVEVRGKAEVSEYLNIIIFLQYRRYFSVIFVK